MRTIQFVAVIFIAVLLGACGKDNNTDQNQTAQIDVSKQWWFDALGNMLTGPGDNQWQPTTFTAQELNLFSSLDTASLAGTTTPVAVLMSSAIYPNPFSTNHAMHFSFPNGYGGSFVLKLVYVDSLMNPVYKKAVRLQCTANPPPTSSGASVIISPSLPVARLTAANPHFHKCWGNIQKL
ncbi:MAG TPA: hypothetical protein VK484_07170 [Ferruginibacter sp.]|nr:hypothetical protein [Ferruginibacter sp.]